MEWWKDISEIIRNFGLLAAAVTGIALAWQRVKAVNKQAEISRRDHVAELFNRAVGQLSDPNLEIRLGSIYTLRQIRDDFPDLSGAVVDLLSTYIRQRKKKYDTELPPVDIQEVLSIVKKRLDGKP